MARAAAKKVAKRAAPPPAPAIAQRPARVPKLAAAPAEGGSRKPKTKRAAKRTTEKSKPPIEPEEFLKQHEFDSSDEITDLRFAFTRKLTFVLRKWRNTLNEEFRVIDQSQARWTALFWIAASKGALNQRELAELIGVETPTLARLLDRLQEDGLIERRAAAEDRRAKTIHLTAAAKPLIRQLARMSERIRSHILGDISPEELRICVSVFDRLIARFGS